MTFTIVGAGRVGTALHSMTSNSILVHRNEIIPDIEGPIIVTTRNDDLINVLEKTPKLRREDLLFVQNGMLQSWLAQHGLENCTQALLYFAVSKMEHNFDKKILSFTYNDTAPA